MLAVNVLEMLTVMHAVNMLTSMPVYADTSISGTQLVRYLWGLWGADRLGLGDVRGTGLLAVPGYTLHPRP
eukprot:1524885-Rhodomonas_salina.1